MDKTWGVTEINSLNGHVAEVAPHLVVAGITNRVPLSNDML